MPDSAPPWLEVMRQITGISAQDDNATIVGWAKFIGQTYPEMQAYCAQYKTDTIAWCGLTVGYCMAKSGIKPVFGPKDVDKFLYALAWEQFGTSTDTPQVGDVLVFDFGGGDHHVTLYEGTHGNTYSCRGGNQSHQVKLSNYPTTQCIAIRRPPSAAAVVQPLAGAVAAPVPQHFTNITATVFGGAADPNTSAYDGHQINDMELGVALPSRFPGARPKVRVWKDGKSVDCDIVDVGPWNTKDPYWATGTRPQAESGTDLHGRKTNGAGIDLTPNAARTIGLGGKGLVDWAFIGADQAPLVTAGDPTINMILERMKELENVMTNGTQPAPATTPPAPQPPASVDQNVARLAQFIAMLGQLAKAAPAASGGTPAQPPLSPIDNALGGQALVGVKTPLAIVAYGIIWIMQSAGALGTVTGDKASTTGQVLTGLAGTLGALGLTAKLDRGVQALGQLSTLMQQLGGGAPPTKTGGSS